MKAVLISIQPRWCELIASGKKTVEVRKTKPKLETPFKVYIYCTKDYSLGEFYTSQEDFADPVQGKVIGEFVCDKIDEYTNYSLEKQKGHIKRREDLLRSACMTLKDWYDYIGNYESDFGECWHISNLVIYDEPKELSEFRTLCKYRNNDGSCQYRKVDCDCVRFDFNPDCSVNFAECCDFMIRPPQSWCYVERLGEG